MSTSRVLLALALLSWLVPWRVARGDDRSIAECGARKVAAVARACSDLLGSEAKFLADGNGDGRARRRAKVVRRVGRAWVEAEASDADGRCAAWTSTPAEAVDLLEAAVEDALARAGSPACGRDFGRLARRLCRRLAKTEETALRSPTEASSERVRAARRVRERLAGRWPKTGCEGELGVEAATGVVSSLAGVAAGTATTRGLKDLAVELDHEIGVAIEPDEVASDAEYLPALGREATSLTAENVMKWRAIHPALAQWSFGPADSLMELADTLGMRVRGHTLVWGASSLPAYVESSSSPEELRAHLEDHITGVVGRYAGRIAQWDVVNEPLPGILDPPTADGLDDNVFRRLLGPGYVAEALHLARVADPSARLFVNENGVAVPGPRQDRFFALVRDLRAAGVPIDGVGLQSHIGLIPPGGYPDRATIEASIRRFADLGLEVELTELDVTLLFRSGDLPSRLAVQGRDYLAIGQGCLAVQACTGITTWGLSDRYTWIRSFFGVEDAPLPFDDLWRRKPAYFGTRGALLGRLFGDG